MNIAGMDRNTVYVVAGGLAVIVVAVAVIISKARGKPGKYAVPDAASIQPGKMKTVKIDGRDVLLIRTVKGQLRATGAKCPHYNLPLSGGVVSEDRVVCNYHGACFSTKTGDIEDGPSLDRIPVYKVTESPDGSCVVELPKEGDLSKPVVPHMCPADSADRRHFVIVGAGPAAQAAAETLRQEGYGGQITLLTRETVGRPYDRVKLSKDLAVTHDKAALRTSDFFRENSIAVRTQVCVTSVIPAQRTVVLAHGERIVYDKLLCASGGPPRMLPGCDTLDNIFPLRDVSHSAGIQGALRSFSGRARVVIVGSSFIGMEAASYLISNKAAASVTVIGMEATPFERVLGPRVGALMQRLFESRGVVFHMGSTVYSFNASKEAAAAGSKGKKDSGKSKKGEADEEEEEAGLPPVGSVTVMPFVPGAKPPPSRPGNAVDIPADVVIIGAGIIPATDYLRDVPGVELDPKKMGGVKVDEYLCTGDENIFAAGDIAVFPYPHAPAGTPPDAAAVRIEHWDVALDHGRAAARNMLGKRAPYKGVPYFWTAQLGKPVRAAGYCFIADKTIVHGNLEDPDVDKARGTVYYVAGGRVASVVTVGLMDNTAVAAMELLRLGALPSPAELEKVNELSLPEVLTRVTAASAASAAQGGPEEDAAAAGSNAAGGATKRKSTRSSSRGRAQ